MAKLKMGDGPSVEILPEACSESRLIYHEVFVDKVYGRNGVTIVDGDCVVDVGANVGMFSMFAMQQTQRLKLFAFEPIPPIHTLLSKNTAALALSGHHTLIVCPWGLSAEKKKGQITYFPGSPANSTCYLEDKVAESGVVGGNTSLSQVWKYSRLSAVGLAVLPPFLRKILIRSKLRRLARHFDTYQVQFLRLNDVIDEYGIERIDLLKIDVEGSEFDVISSLTEESWSKVQQLVMEVSPKHVDKIESLRNQLEERGFRSVEIETMGHTKFLPESGSTCSLYATRKRC